MRGSQHYIMAHTVLLDPSLLYIVLIHLPQRDLLLSQRVCRTWHDLISSSRVLQAALFFQPDAETAEMDTASGSEGASIAVHPNPLLKMRFPAFFDEKTHSNSTSPRALKGKPDSNLGPWASTHWHGGCSKTDYAAKDGIHSECMAAYTRAEASWRRMIPCKPAPTELQFYSGTSSMAGSWGTLKCLVLRPDYHPDADGSMGSVEKEEERSRPPWLTFGLLYDVIEHAWFGRDPYGVTNIKMDFSFPFQMPSDASEETIPLILANSQALEEMKRRRWQKTVPQRQVGGPRRVLVEIEDVQQCAGRDWKADKVIYRDEFRCDGSMADEMGWDIEFPVNDRRW